MKQGIMALACAALVVSGCATPPEKVQRSFISPSVYAGYSCHALTAERAAIEGHVQELTAHQRSKANTDTAVMTVGLVLFWPALFALSAGKDYEADLSIAKGKHDAVLEAGQSLGCFSGYGAQSEMPPTLMQRLPERAGGFPPL
ncbi:hypothetical protein [Dinoroseobacter sp. S375]|uniref:hypothetical protein n=1 Tax=Dinoroseobacter sp. S375 TaxID=3415136 RepID=UPI003C7CB3C4